MKVRRSGLAVMIALSITSCDLGGKPTMPFDDMATQAIQNIRALPEILSTPCFPTMTERDYRYSYCFQDTSGSTALTFEKMDKIMTAAGFKKASQGSDSSELDGTYRAPGTPYTVNLGFSSGGIDWTVYEADRGFVAPRPGVDDGANYALLDPSEMARQMLFELVLSGGYFLDNGLPVVKACGEDSDRQASACTTVDFTPTKARDALVKRFFGNDRAWFDPLEAKPTFEYRQEPLMAEMLKEGSRKADEDLSSLLVRKESADTYVMTDKYSWPAYEFRFTLPTTKAGVLKVTATRRNAPPKP